MIGSRIKRAVFDAGVSVDSVRVSPASPRLWLASNTTSSGETRIESILARKLNRVTGRNRECRPTGEGTEQGQTNLLNRDRRSKAAVLTRPRQQPRVGLVKPSPVRQAVRLLHRRIAECWKQHGYRQRDHLLSTNTRYFPLNGGSSAVFKPLSTQDHSLSNQG